MRHLLILLVVLLLPSMASAQKCPDGYTCVEDSDMEQFLELARQKKCMQETLPAVVASDLVVTVDDKGRVFNSGTGMQPYTLHVDWCQYRIEASSQIILQVAKKEEPSWGFRFRLKAAFGFVLSDVRLVQEISDLLDGGFMFDFFYFRWLNADVFVGFRSVGAGLGVDLTKNAGLYLGYAVTWRGMAKGSVRQAPSLMVSFSF